MTKQQKKQQEIDSSNISNVSAGTSNSSWQRCRHIKQFVATNCSKERPAYTVISVRFKF